MRDPRLVLVFFPLFVCTQLKYKILNNWISTATNLGTYDWSSKDSVIVRLYAYDILCHILRMKCKHENKIN